MRRPSSLLLCAITLTFSLFGGNLFSATGVSHAQAQTLAFQHKRLMILPFRNLTQHEPDNWLGDSFSESLVMGLGRLPSLRLVERAEISQILKEQAFMQSMLADSHQAPQLGRMVGADYVILGSFQKVGEQIQANVRVVNVSTGEIEGASLSQVQGHFEQLFHLQQDLANQLITKLEIQAPHAQLAQLQKAMNPTRSTEAYRLYMLGRSDDQEILSDQDLQRSIHYFQQALSHDAQYALAYAGLAERYAYRAMGSKDFYPSQQVNDAEQALHFAQEAYRLDPAQSLSSRALSYAFKAGGKKEAALQFARQALEQEATALNVTWYINLRMSQQIREPLELDTVEAELKQLGADLDDPFIVSTLAGLALVYWTENPGFDLGSTIARLESVWQKQPRYAGIPLLLSSAYLMQGHLPKVKEWSEKTIAASPDNPLLIYLSANFLRFADKDAARQVLTSSMNRFPSLAHLQQMAGSIEHQQFHSPERAHRFYNKAKELAPQDGTIWMGIAANYAQNGDHQQALQHYQQAILLLDSRHKPYAQKGLADSHLQMGHALEAYPLYLELSQNAELQPAFRGLIYHALSQIMATQEDFTQALHYYQLFVNFAPVYAKKSKYQDDYKRYWLHEQIRLHPQEAPYYNDLGQLYLSRKADGQAQIFLEKARQLAPENTVILTNLGALYLSQARLSDAQWVLEQAILLNPDALKAHYNLALVYSRQGRSAQARQQWQEVLRLDPQHAEARGAIGS